MEAEDPSRTAGGNHFSCSMTAVLLARLRGWGGDEAVARVLEAAGSARTPEYLSDIANWVSYDEAVALWKAGARVTHHPQFARALGEEAARRLNASPVAALLRSLGSPEAVYRQIAITSGKFSVVITMEAVDVGPGYAEIVANAIDGFPRTPDHCAYTSGLLTQTTVLFGLPPATVRHDECAAFGAEQCRYHITWNVDDAALYESGAGGVGPLREQLEAMKERLHSMFATASDLIDAGDLADVLARIADRAAMEVRAPRYLLAVRMVPGGPVHCHHKGFDQDEADEYAGQILDCHPASLPKPWLVVPVRSKRQDYGRLLAMYDREQGFFPQERELMEVYARYAASALDGACALMEAKQRYAQSSALLELARALAAAGTSGEVAQRLAEAVPAVVDCDRVGVYLWDAGAGRLIRAATSHRAGVLRPAESEVAAAWSPRPGGGLAGLIEDPAGEPLFVEADHPDPVLRRVMASIGARAMIAQPLAAPDSLLGLLAVSVAKDPERLKPSPDLFDRLSGVAAQATIALQNGRLVDQMTHQALHDQLTGLPNRLQFNDRLRGAVAQARSRNETVTLFYLDLDGFKPVNDEFGHEVGDKLLVHVGDRLAACLRGSDTVARLGGDEFAVLIDGPAPPDAVEALGQRLVGAFAEPFRCGPKRVRLGASIGRAVFPTDADDAEGLLRLADRAMFEAKRAKRGRSLRAVP
jgi:diguanylate cyclase (GGDEF)-like protein